MIKTLVASDIKRLLGFVIPPPGKRCYIIINDAEEIEMVHCQVKGLAAGVVWYLVCPVTKKRCRKLHFSAGRYVHWSVIRGYYRKNKPAWWSETQFNKILIKKQGMIDAEKTINSKHFKSHYGGKPTKRYLKCMKQIEEGSGYPMLGIINGYFDRAGNV